MSGQPEEHDHEPNPDERIESVDERRGEKRPARRVPVVGAAHGLERPGQDEIEGKQAEHARPDRNSRG